MTNSTNHHLLKQRLMDRQEQLIDKVKQFTEAKYEFSQEIIGELSNYDNHPADTGTELFEREKDSALQRHIEAELEEINQALHAMEEGTYGICKVCGEMIDTERLEAVPTADCCVEHAEKRTYHGETRAEQVFRGRDDGGENSWLAVRQYGTSSLSPHYYESTGMPEDGEEVSVDMDVEDFVAADMEGKFTRVMPNHEGYERLLDEEESDE